MSIYAIARACLCIVAYPSFAALAWAQSQAAPASDSRQLSLGVPIEREIKGGETHLYEIQAQPDQYLRVSVEQKGIDVSLAIFEPGGAKFVEVDRQPTAAGMEVLSIITKKIGAFRLVVRSTDNKASSGRYLLNLLALRDATDKEREAIAADGLIAQADALRQVGKTDSLQTALEKYLGAVPRLKLADDRAVESDTLIKIGSIYEIFGQYEKAQAVYQQALTIKREIKDRRGEGNAVNSLAIVSFHMGQFELAREHFESAMLIRRETNDRKGIGESLNNLAAIYRDLAQFDRSLDFYRQSLAIRRELKDRRGEGNVLNNLGIVYQRLSQHEKALDHHMKALEIKRETQDLRGEATVLNNMAIVYESLSQYPSAKQYFEQALSIYQQVNDRRGQVEALTSLGGILKYLNQLDRAAEHHEQALKIAREIKNISGESSALDSLANIQLQMGQSMKAIENYDLALARAREAKNLRAESRTLHNLGVAYSGTGHQNLALERYLQALALRRQTKDRRGEASTLHNLSTIYVYLKRYDEAKDSVEKALALRYQIGDRFGQADSHNNLSEVLRILNKRRLAIHHGKRAVNTMQLLRKEIREFDKPAQKGFVTVNERIYRNLAGLLIEEGRLDEALQVLNLFKDQQFFDFTVSSDAPRLLPMSEREKALADKLPDTEIDLDPSEIPRLLRETETAFETAPSAADALPKIPDATELRSALTHLRHSSGARAAAVYTLISNDRYIGLIVTADSISSVSVPVKAVDLKQRASQFWGLLRSPKYDPRPLAKELYDIVFAPIEKKLPAGTNTILWSLDANLRYIPMAALYDGRQYLTERFENVVFTRADKERMTRAVSSLQVGTGLGSSEAHTVELAGSTFNASALPSVKTELDSIFLGRDSTGVLAGSVLVDSAFTKAAMIREMKITRPLVHIASHFKFEPGDEARSFLLMGDGTPFTLDEMKQQTDLFKGVDLLTLSACETAAQQPDANGREVDGFAELAQRLGAGAVMASLWEVSDDSTAELMARFYRGYRGRSGVSKARALRQAQLALLRGEYSKPLSEASRQLERERSDAATPADVSRLKLYRPSRSAPYSHPYYWSPFVLIGNWK